jgi:hypothetical protein
MFRLVFWVGAATVGVGLLAVYLIAALLALSGMATAGGGPGEDTPGSSRIAPGKATAVGSVTGTGTDDPVIEEDYRSYCSRTASPSPRSSSRSIGASMSS